MAEMLRLKPKLADLYMYRLSSCSFGPVWLISCTFFTNEQYFSLTPNQPTIFSAMAYQSNKPKRTCRISIWFPLRNDGATIRRLPWYQQPNTSIAYVLTFFLILKGSNWNKFEARWGHGPCESLQLAPFLALKCFSLLFDWPWCLMLIVYDRLHGHTDF